MRNLLPLLFLLIPTAVFAQKVKLHLKSDSSSTGEFVSDKIKANSNEQLYGEAANYSYDNIITVHFITEPSPSLVDRLTEKGIVMVHKYNEDPLYPGIYVKKEPKNEVDLKLENAFVEKEVGDAVKILGLAAVVSSIVLQYSEFKNEPVTEEDLERRENTVKGLAVGGGIGFVIGTTISLSGDYSIMKLLKPKKK